MNIQKVCDKIKEYKNQSNNKCNFYYKLYLKNA